MGVLDRSSLGCPGPESMWVSRTGGHVGVQGRKGPQQGELPALRGASGQAGDGRPAHGEPGEGSAEALRSRSRKRCNP